MSYTESNATCDWCKSEIGDGDNIACQACYETLDEENQELKARVHELEKELAEAEAGK